LSSFQTPKVLKTFGVEKASADPSLQGELSEAKARRRRGTKSLGE